VVQIANERGHRVASDGPYRHIRHPMYASLILSWPALAFLLGSYWALIPGILASILIIIRTILEDRTLLAELPGYRKYTHRTPYRLIPWVW
jgi:protein-S-isoprenylcysteine O-methyltransferase Ste14